MSIIIIIIKRIDSSKWDERIEYSAIDLTMGDVDFYLVCFGIPDKSSVVLDRSICVGVLEQDASDIIPAEIHLIVWKNLNCDAHWSKG